MSPLLFILVMEYLSRCSGKLKKQPDFNFHSRCENLSITNLCFSDDRNFVELIMNHFKEFSGKSDEMLCVFCRGVSEDSERDVLEATGFCKGNSTI